jgi:hypothetical protein
MPGFHVEHFGCRAARADGEAVSDHMRTAGLREHSPTAALTENFLPSEVDGRLPANRLVRLRITGLSPEGTLRAVCANRH